MTPRNCSFLKKAPESMIEGTEPPVMQKYDTFPTTAMKIIDETHNCFMPLLQWLNETKRPRYKWHYQNTLTKERDRIMMLSDMAIVVRGAVEVPTWKLWVHRDISINPNFMGSRTLLFDLDHANRAIYNSKHMILTGTVDFMAVEVAEGGYNYLLPDSETKDRQLELLNQGRHDEVLTEMSRLSVVPFFYNDLHDLESLWWIAIWCLSFCRDKLQNGVNADGEDCQKLVMQRIPSRSLKVNDRLELFQSGYGFRQEFAWLPESFAIVRIILDILRELLRSYYFRFEATFPEINSNVSAGLEEVFQKQLEHCQKLVHSIGSIPMKAAEQRCTM